jgi:hypothetical protein
LAQTPPLGVILGLEHDVQLVAELQLPHPAGQETHNFLEVSKNWFFKQPF